MIQDNTQLSQKHRTSFIIIKHLDLKSTLSNIHTIVQLKKHDIGVIINKDYEVDQYIVCPEGVQPHIKHLRDDCCCYLHTNIH